MNILEALLLGVLQGVTEWLPISSSGQTMLFLINLMHISPDEAFSITVMLHLGSLLAVLVYFRDKLRDSFERDRNLLNFLLIASLASAVVGLPLYKGFRDVITTVSGEAATMFIGVMLIATGMVLKNTGRVSRSNYDSRDAIAAGGAQGFSVLPGVSRSGTTIAALLIRGVEQEKALSLSFLLSIPAILGLAVIETMHSGLATLSTPMLVGIGSSFFVSLLTMHYFLALARKVDFSRFLLLVGSMAFFIPLLFMALG